MSMKWYVVHTYSGYENKARLSLQERVKQMGKDAPVRRDPDPDRDRCSRWSRASAAPPRASSIPGYMFVQMELNEETCHLVKNTPKVTGFLGGTNPTPVPREGHRRDQHADDRGRGQAEAAHLVRGGRERPRHRRPVRQLHRHRRRSEGREAEGPRAGVRSSAAPRRSSSTSRRSKRRSDVHVTRNRLRSTTVRFSLQFSELGPITLLPKGAVMKKVTGHIKLQLPAGKANPSPPVGPALGQHGVNIMEFCKSFNAKTQAQAKDDLIIPVVITVYTDRSFTFITKTPPAASCSRRRPGIEKGSGEPNKNKVGKVTKKQVREIAQLKMPDMNTTSLEAAMRTIEGTARSMGLDVVD